LLFRWVLSVPIALRETRLVAAQRRLLLHIQSSSIWDVIEKAIGTLVAKALSMD
jgi:hypothetical protein